MPHVKAEAEVVLLGFCFMDVTHTSAKRRTTHVTGFTNLLKDFSGYTWTTKMTERTLVQISEDFSLEMRINQCDIIDSDLFLRITC